MLGSGLPREAKQWSCWIRNWRVLRHCTLLLTHYPLFIKTPDKRAGSTWNIEPEPRKRLLVALKKGGVKAVLSGHLHSPLNLQADGITYITTQACLVRPAARQTAGRLDIGNGRAGRHGPFRSPKHHH